MSFLICVVVGDVIYGECGLYMFINLKVGFGFWNVVEVCVVGVIDLDVIDWFRSDWEIGGLS